MCSQTPPSLRATSPNLGEEPSYRIGCYRHWNFHSLFKLWYIGSSPKAFYVPIQTKIRLFIVQA
ncbi:MAG: hypothetical protein LUD00_09930 [Prevotellaceae bacterium]|nr:hypothetical protein [Prevotellaceae bacterium]